MNPEFSLAADKLEQALLILRKLLPLYPSRVREISIAITEAETALMWLNRGAFRK